jgi:hypothetical protein
MTARRGGAGHAETGAAGFAQAFVDPVLWIILWTAALLSIRVRIDTAVKALRRVADKSAARKR